MQRCNPTWDISRRGEGPLVESEVRISPRLVEINNGYKSHVSYSDKNCLPCNAAPPLVQNKLVKNLATSFCKVAKKDFEGKVRSKESMKDKKKKEVDVGTSKLQEKKEKEVVYPMMLENNTFACVLICVIQWLVAYFNKSFVLLLVKIFCGWINATAQKNK